MKKDPITKSLLREDVFSVKAGSIVIQTPPIAPEEMEDVDAFFGLIRARLNRDFAPKPEPAFDPAPAAAPDEVEP